MATFPMKPAAGRAMGVTYKMTRLPADAIPCVPTALQLAWFTDSAGAFSETAEAAYLLPLPDLAAGPVLAVAGILGETCGAPIQWITAWAPEGTDDEPGLFEDGNRLVVWPKPGCGPGLLTVWAHIAGRRYGPINLTVLRYQCAGYGYEYSVFSLDPLTWETGATTIEFTNTWDNPGVTHTATVTGTWPAGTAFVWSGIDSPPYGFTASGVENVLTVSFNSFAAGTLTASCTAHYPDGSSETVGPITLTVYPY
jgi:hypothetical protein